MLPHAISPEPFYCRHVANDCQRFQPLQRVGKVYTGPRVDGPRPQVPRTANLAALPGSARAGSAAKLRMGLGNLGRADSSNEQSPEGTTVNEPRVERRERSERRATLGCDHHV